MISRNFASPIAMLFVTLIAEQRSNVLGPPGLKRRGFRMRLLSRLLAFVPLVFVLGNCPPHAAAQTVVATIPDKGVPRVVASRLGAQAQHAIPRYLVITLPTLGGTYGTAQQMNRDGLISGDSNLTGDDIDHATLWRDAAITDLGTLGGLNSAAAQVNKQGLISGVAQTAEVDPLGENWGSLLTCSAGGTTCQGFQNLVVAAMWKNGAITRLPTLGGNNAQVAFTSALNNKGEIVGFAETGTHDPNCVPPQVLDWEAVIWGPTAGEIRQLDPLPNDYRGCLRHQR
jgi:probable HAF family extracellular repeat protein